MRGILEQWVRTAWYAPQQLSALQALAWAACRPIFWALSRLTKTISAAKRTRIHSQKALAERAYVKAPLTNGPLVVVVGNLVAGGAGKTPIALALANGLINRGYKVGMIARGQADEAQWLKDHCLGPVVCHPQRAQALAQLKREYPQLQFIVSDDGLQHEALPRHKELLVIDPRGFGNAELLPLGPLREPLAAAELADALILSKGLDKLPSEVSALAHTKEMFLCSNEPGAIVSLMDRSTAFSAAAWVAHLQSAHGLVDASSLRLGALAAIASPADFFSQTRRLLLPTRVGLDPKACAALPDHSTMPESTLRNFISNQGLHAILITEKDAPKYQYLAENLKAKIWVQELVTELDPRLIDFVEQALVAELVADTMST